MESLDKGGDIDYPLPRLMTDTFNNLGICPEIMGVLERLRFTIPTPIQHQSIPAGLAGKDIIGIAQTGTGKTLAFGIPMVQRLQAIPGRGLILLPTRELALQVNEMLQKVVRPFNMWTAVLIGGESMFHQIAALRRRPRILVATPGRLIDHMQQKLVSLEDISVLVLDEADRMFDMGFAPQINQIIRRLPTDRQTLLYSATMPHAIVNIATAHMKLPVRVEVAPSGTAAENVEQEIIVVEKDAKQALLETVLRENEGTVLVFSRTKIGARKICRNLSFKGYKVAEIHADRSQAQRKQALAGFKNGRYRILIATDIAARGIDVKNIGLVINYDLPDNSEDYVHRIGRTGRAGLEGKAISFATPDQRWDVKDIEKLIRKTLKIVSLPGSSSFIESASKTAPGRTRSFKPRRGHTPRFRRFR